MHVVILNDSLPPDSAGGAGRVAWNLGHGLLAAGHRVTFVTTTRGPSGVEIRQGVSVHVLHSNYAQHWRAWFGLLNPQTIVPLNRLLRQLKPDVVHAHNVYHYLGYHSLVIGRFAHAATVFTAHNVMPVAYGALTHFIDPTRPDQRDGFDYRLPFGYNWRQMWLRWNPARNLSIRHTMTYYTDMRVAISHELKHALEANRLPPFEVVYNGIDPALYNVPEAGIAVLRQRYNLNGRRVILFGGQAGRQKGDQQLVVALRRVRQAVPDVALLVLAQADGYAQALIAANPDLAQVIVPGGWLEASELATAYRLADVVVTPSIVFDPFPLMNLEAMAAGTPVVTTLFGGAHELVRDGQTGYIVNPYDTDALADRLTRLLTDHALRERLGDAGQRRAREQFTLTQQADAMLDVYARAIERHERLHGKRR